MLSGVRAAFACAMPYMSSSSAERNSTSSETQGTMSIEPTRALSSFCTALASSASCAAITSPPFASTAARRSVRPSSLGAISSLRDTRLYTRRNGVSMNPNSFTLAYVARLPISPMFGPSGVSIGQMRP